jgi:hypothetical protein
MASRIAPSVRKQGQKKKRWRVKEQEAEAVITRAHERDDDEFLFREVVEQKGKNTPLPLGSP